MQRGVEIHCARRRVGAFRRKHDALWFFRDPAHRMRDPFADRMFHACLDRETSIGRIYFNAQRFRVSRIEYKRNADFKLLQFDQWFGRFADSRLTQLFKLPLSRGGEA